MTSLRSLTLALFTLAAVTPLAAQRTYRLELSAGGAYTLYDNKTELGNSFGGVGRLGYWIAGPVSVEVEGSFARPSTDTPLDKTVKVSSLGAWGLLNFPLGAAGTTQLFLKAGYGHVSYGSCPAVSVPGAGPCGGADVVQGGAGVRIALKPTLFMRYEGTFNRSTTTLKFSNVALQAGVSLMLGSRPVLDSDQDGVHDQNDRCKGTRLGALVDKRGCPTDRDRDGVPDGLDRCPNSLAGATVDAAGCTSDSDEDGVLDGLDQCPDTPKGALINAEGCPRDGDGDTVFDGLDRCPETPAGATTDALGCPGDQDNDRVLDGLDRCPDTRAGAAVDARGCPTDPADTAAAPPAATERRWRIPGAVWQFRGTVLDSTAYPALDSVVAVLQADPSLSAEISGFAHDRLVPADNTRLSQRRAEVVRNYFIAKGIPVSRVTAIGRGSEPLLVDDTTDEARTLNRRIEITVTRGP